MADWKTRGLADGHHESYPDVTLPEDERASKWTP